MIVLCSMVIMIMMGLAILKVSKCWSHSGNGDRDGIFGDSEAQPADPPSLYVSPKKSEFFMLILHFKLF